MHEKTYDEEAPPPLLTELRKAEGIPFSSLLHGVNEHLRGLWEFSCESWQSWAGFGDGKHIPNIIN